MAAVTSPEGIRKTAAGRERGIAAQEARRQERISEYLQSGAHQLDPAAAARLLGVSVRTIERYRVELGGQLPQRRHLQSGWYGYNPAIGTARGIAS